MPFDLATAPSLFKNFISNVLYRILNDFCTTYIDNILIYNNFEKEYQAHI